MIKEKYLLWCAIALSILSVCISLDTNAKKAADTNVINAAGSESSIFRDLRQQKYEIERLNNLISNAQNAISDIRLKNVIAQHNSAGFEISDNSFRIIKSTYGDLLVSLRSVEKYGNGYKLVFDFGNPMALTLVGLKGKITWKPTVDWQKYFSDKTYQDEIDSKTQSKEFEILSDIYPASWNKSVITIAPANEETIGEITIEELVSKTVKMRNLPLQQ